MKRHIPVCIPIHGGYFLARSFNIITLNRFNASLTSSGVEEQNAALT